jgi:ferredoxin
VELFATILLIVIGFLNLVGFIAFGQVSHSEGERRAMRVSFLLAFLTAVPFFLAAALPLSLKWVVLGAVATVILVSIVLFALPVGHVGLGDDIPHQRFDEREIMFARARLEPGTPEYQSYYAAHAEHKAGDDHTRTKPGLLSSEAQLANPYLFASPQASFTLTEALREAVDGPVANQRCELPIEEMTAYLKNLALFYGALDVGITTLQPYHVYSHIGRGTGTYGEPVPIEHRSAIAFTVEMDFGMVGTSPEASITMETGKQYVEAARVAVQLAAAIRHLGYSARAHIDGNYRVIAPLVARDAGLGEIGRMTILITPRQGPRVRLGVVTTDLELIPDQRQPNPALIDFCNICKKCAENCPSRSISFDDREEIDGALRWKLDPETCFRYWNVVGTDCGRCMAVCPFAHPDSFSHNLIRWGISKSGVFRRLALRLDDLFYGKEPAVRQSPHWTRIPSKIPNPTP